MSNLLGNLFGGGTTTSSSNSAPWSAQQPYLQGLFGAAAQNYNTQEAAGPYTGSFYSPENSTQIGAQTQAAGYASGTGANLAGGAAGTAGGLFGLASPFGANASTLASNGYSSPGLSSALNSAALSGVGTLNKVASAGTGNPTGAILSNAQTYENSAPVQQELNATNAAIGQTLNEQTLPGLDRQAAMGGGLNSSRAGAADAEAREGAGIAEGSADAGIMNNAFNTGLGTAANEYNTGQANALSAGASELGANLGLSNLNASTELGANAQLGTGVGLGFSGATTSSGLAGNNYTLGSTAGSASQQDQNNQLQNLYDQWQQQNNYNSGILGQYSGLINGNYGQTASGSSTAPTNVAGGLLGLGVLAGTPGLAGSGGWFGPNSLWGAL